MSLIDVHAHYLPEVYREALEATGQTNPDGMREIPAWDASEHLSMMDRLGIRTSFLSISSPGVHFGDDHEARALAREVNVAGHRVVRSHPGRFGLFASVPLPDVAGALAEIEYAYDTLGADGVVLLTNAGGVYLGDPALEPVFDQLDRRHSRVFLHPVSPACWERTSLGRPRPMLEFLFDTTRAVINMILNGTIARHPNLEVIVPHAGATLPSIADRIAAFAFILADVDPAADVLRDLARLHYDLAGFAIPRQIDALLTLTSFEHLHYGSDYPFTPESVAGALASQLDQRLHGGGDPTILQLQSNTRRIFPGVLS
jgi:predicted TIM-barrel fold metal-dependent hydrolase